MARAIMAAFMSEADLDENVRDAADKLGLLRYHTHRSDRSPRGFPDLVLVGRCGVLWRELKSQDGRATPTQREWLAALVAAGQDADVWRPADWLSGRIVAELRAIAGR